MCGDLLDDIGDLSDTFPVLKRRPCTPPRARARAKADGEAILLEQMAVHFFALSAKARSTSCDIAPETLAKARVMEAAPEQPT